MDLNLRGKIILKHQEFLCLHSPLQALLAVPIAGIITKRIWALCVRALQLWMSLQEELGRADFASSYKAMAAGDT